MGATKDWVMQVEESRREEWIRERLSSPDLEEDSEEWQLLEHDPSGAITMVSSCFFVKFQ